MILLSLEIVKFRNYIQSKINFDKHRNIISGKNAQGKSNLLEAIYLLCISRSFRTKHEKETINFDNDYCSIKGKFLLKNGTIKTVTYHYSRSEGKNVSINRKKISKLSEYIGQYPIVFSSPDEYNLTSGPPAERRKFFNILLSQISIKYIHNLQDYQRILKQRNKILSDKKTHILHDLEPWTDALIEKGSLIIRDRYCFIDNFSTRVEDVYKELNDSKEHIKFIYNSVIEGIDLDTIKKNFELKLATVIKAEIKKGVTLVGPHRDDFIFLLNDKNLRKFGSRGQHKTVLIALMIAEFELLKEKIGEIPIILIDDLFSEIDKIREDKVLKYLAGLGQTFITTTIENDDLDKYSLKKSENKYFTVENGIINEAI